MQDAVIRILEEAGSGAQGRRRLAAGELLIREGDSSDDVFVLVGGTLTVFREVDGSRMVLATLDEPGTVVGEIVALGGGERSASVEAVTDATVYAFDRDVFVEMVESHPVLTRELTALATRRAEEGELLQVLSHRYGVDDEESMAEAVASASWLRLEQGEVLFREGDESKTLYLVIRGRLAAWRADEIDGRKERRGEAGRGDVVGEIGIIRQSPRTATMVALRDTVLACFDDQAFFRILDRHPRVMLNLGLQAMERAEAATERSSPNTVLAVMGSPEVDLAHIVEGLQRELQRHGSVLHMSTQKVESTLQMPGIAESKAGEVGDIRLSRFLHDAELDNDHLLLEVGDAVGEWSRRVLGMADRVLVCVPGGAQPEDLAPLVHVLDSCPSEFHRTAVVVHPAETASPRGTASIASTLGAEDVANVRRGSESDIARVARVGAGRAVALVLSGGGGRGFAHIGVWEALEELGVTVDIVGGSSIGAILGAVMADGISADQLKEWARVHFRRPLDYTIPIVSLIKGERIARSTREVFEDRSIEDLWCKYFAVSTNLTDSRVHVHRRGPLDLAIRATSAIPGVMPPVPLDEHLLIDGGVLNNLPIDVARDLAPAGTIIAVDVASPQGPGARSDYGLSVSGWQALRSGFGGRRRAYPAISAVLMRSMIISSTRERDEQVSSGMADCYIDLDMRGVSMLDFDDPDGVARRGYQSALPQLKELGDGLPAAGRSGHG